MERLAPNAGPDLWGNTGEVIGVFGILDWGAKIRRGVIPY